MARTTRIARPSSNAARFRAWTAIGFGLVLGLSGTQAAVGQAPPAQPPDLAATVERLATQLQALERRNAALADQNESLADRLADVTGKYDDLSRRLQRIEPASPGSSIPPSPRPRPRPRRWTPRSRASR
ncbi:hypothetical protein [Planctomyces sp. SH-PL62]|uniref:hypothetical protein n=1 Tax=Planctomyces sp. SH-PL62 TaxID=1636152 RepID=UPI00078EBA1A|nr:hypothetical protein [Planctomyces sp. SH-PL62]AMV36164.1 hypothetical protein VT85_01880 [Planctomyces sp. SH-PL62]